MADHCEKHTMGGLPAPRQGLLLIAHPDDESMFFAPTIIRLQELGVNLSLLCLSNGRKLIANSE